MQSYKQLKQKLSQWFYKVYGPYLRDKRGLIGFIIAAFGPLTIAITFDLLELPRYGTIYTTFWILVWLMGMVAMLWDTFAGLRLTTKKNMDTLYALCDKANELAGKEIRRNLEYMRLCIGQYEEIERLRKERHNGYMELCTEQFREVERLRQERNETHDLNTRLMEKIEALKHSTTENQ